MPVTKGPRKLMLYRDLDGGVQAGYDYADLPLVHTIIRGEQGERLSAETLTRHWPCKVCAQHNYTPDDFVDQWPAALDAFNAAEARRNAAEAAKTD